MSLEFNAKELILQINDDAINLHPLWMRERSKESSAVDQISMQRLYDPEEIETNLQFSDAKINDDQITVRFSDQHEAKYSLKELLTEVNGYKDLPEKQLWDSSQINYKEFKFNYKLDPDPQLLKILEYYHRYGFAIVTHLKPLEGEIINFAERIGFIRETNFGKTFNVKSMQQPNDLAYTSIELGPHTDNPYRKPVPSIQFLFCVENTCVGGNSTLVDGFKVALDLKKENPNDFNNLLNTEILFKFEDKDAVLENSGKTIELDENGEMVQIRFSNRLDFVPHHEPKKLETFYKSKRLFHKMINSEKYLINF